MMRTRWLLLAAAAGLMQAGVAAADAPTPEQGLPLKIARQVQFQTDEGTWMDVDLAPNGKTILFDLLGELYTVDVAGGPAKLLLGGLAFESQARYSPDGKHIAFISDRSGNQNLWMADADGSNLRQLSREQGDPWFNAPRWSADGESIYVSRSEESGATAAIWKYGVASATGVLLAGPEKSTGRLATGLALSADGHYLYFASASADPGNQYGSLPVWKIVRRDLRTDQEVTVVHAPGSAMQPVLSPDGQRMVYATRVDGQTGLRLRDLVSGADRWLAYPVQLDSQATLAYRSYGLMPSFTFTPDGNALLLSLNGKIQRMQIDSGAATVIPFTADVSLDVGPRLQFDQKISDGPVRARLIQSPQQSPDGRDLAFSALGSIYVMRLSGGTPRRLAEGFQPSWSTDGRSIVYVSWQAGDGGHVWRVSARGGTPQRLTQAPAYYTDPVFDSTGKTVYVLRSSAYEQSQTEKSDLYVNRVADIVRLAADGTSTTLLSQQPLLSALRFLPSSGRLSFEGEGRSVQSMSTDGTDRRTHVSVRGPESSAPVLLSPDQRWALAQAGGQLYLFAVAADGGTVDLNDAAMQRWRISELGADYFAWADGGKTITWALGREFHRIRLDKIDRTIRGRDTPAASRGTENFSVRVEVPRDIPQGTLVLRGAAAITMKGDEVIEDADVVIVNNRISAVGHAGQVAIPKGAVVRDVKGRFIVPGFIDTHAHWLHSRFDVLDLKAWTFNINLAHGVTAGLDPQSFTQDVFAYGDMIDAGLMTGQRAFSTGRGVGLSGERMETAEDMSLIERRYRDAYGTHNLKSYDVGNRRKRQLFINAAQELGMMPTVENLTLQTALTHAIDGYHGNEHDLRTLPVYRDVIELFSRTGIGFTPTVLVTDGGPRAANYFYITERPHENPKMNRFMPHFVLDMNTRRRNWYREDEQTFPRVAQVAHDIAQAGGRIGVGSHGEFQGLAFHWEMQALASGGMTPMQVLRAATRNGSEFIGRADDLGSLEAGKLADLVILSRDPRQDIRHAQEIEFVMKNGRLYVGDTLDEVWPRQRPMPAAWFKRLEERPHAN